MRFLEVWLVLAVTLVIGCTNPSGQRCESSACPDGYSCALSSEGDPRSPSTVRRCAQRCERRSDCGELCAPSRNGDGLLCRDIGGDLALGDACTGQDADFDFCRAGMQCGPTNVCLPACNSFTTHSDDRACPSGFACDARDVGVVGGGLCRQECDPSIADDCGDPQQVCVRYQDSSGRMFGICESAISYIFCPTQCLMTEVCVDDVCYPSTSAPPLPWTQPELPPLTD